MKTKRPAQADDLRSEYNFDYSTAVRGKYYRRLIREGANVAVLEPDVARVPQFGCGERGPPISVAHVRDDPSADTGLNWTGRQRPPLTTRIPRPLSHLSEMPTTQPTRRRLAGAPPE
jgi:hypothetical protein